MSIGGPSGGAPLGPASAAARLRSLIGAEPDPHDAMTGRLAAGEAFAAGGALRHQRTHDYGALGASIVVLED